MTATAFYSPKGGQGCTTVALAFAHQQGRRFWSIHNRDHLDIAGVTEPPDWFETAPFDAVPSGSVLDLGVTEPWNRDMFPDIRWIMVVRGPCYVALTRAHRHERRPDRIVLIREPGRALEARDVTSVIGAPVVVELDLDPAVARAVDAGLLLANVPKSLQRLECVEDVNI